MTADDRGDGPSSGGAVETAGTSQTDVETDSLSPDEAFAVLDGTDVV